MPVVTVRVEAVYGLARRPPEPVPFDIAPPAASRAMLGFFGDECNTVSLAAGWTLRNIASVAGDGMKYLALFDAWGDAMTRPFTDPAADFEIMAHLVGLTDGGGMIGLCALDAAGAGRAFSYYNDGTTYNWKITSYTYDTTGSLVPGTPAIPDHWLRLRRVSGSWSGCYSTNGNAWSNWTTGNADGRTITQIGILRAYFSGGSQTLGRGRFVYGTPTIVLP